MRLVPNLSGEFEELCESYAAVDQQGKDIVTLVKMFGDEYDYLRFEVAPEFVMAWEAFLEEHKHQVTVPMVGLILYVLITYWDMGPLLATQLPTLERILIRDTVQDISDEIDRRSAANGNAVLVVPE
jgi:hypothetical protein